MFNKILNFIFNTPKLLSITFLTLACARRKHRAAGTAIEQTIRVGQDVAIQLKPRETISLRRLRVEVEGIAVHGNGEAAHEVTK